MLAPTKPVKSCECGSPCGGCCCCTKESIGLGNVDNTSDLNKPLSVDMINALSGKVDLDIFTQLKNRVLALENSIPDITALENRMTNAETNIVTLQSNYANLSQAIGNLTATVNTLSGRVTNVNDALVTVGTRVDALEAKDSNNVKLSGVNIQTVQGTLKANDPASGATDKTLVTANWVSQSGVTKPNNLIHTIGNEIKYGTLSLPDGIESIPIGWHLVSPVSVSSMPLGYYCIFAKITPHNNGHYMIIDFMQASNNANEAGRLAIHCWRGVVDPIWLYRKSRGAQANLSTPDNIVVLDDGVNLYLAWHKTSTYGNLMGREWLTHSYYHRLPLGSKIEWYDDESFIITNDISKYTVIAPID